MEPNTLPAWLLLASASLLLTVPAAGAEDYPFGSYVDTGDTDHVPAAEAVEDVRLCMIDEDGSDHWTEGEPLVLSFDGACDRVSYEDRCLVCLDDKGPGAEIEMADPEHDRFLTAVDDHNLTYVDMANENGVDPDNPTYIDLRNPQAERVDPGDLRLTSWKDHEALTTVEPGDADAGVPVSHVTGDPWDFNATDALLEQGDGFYLNTDGGTPGADFDHVPGDAIRLDDAVTDPARALIEDAMAEMGTETGEPNITAGQLAIEPTEASPGELVRIHVTAANHGQAAGAGTIDTALDGEVFDVRGTPTLEPGQQAKLVIPLPAPDAEGEVTVSVGSLEETLAIEPAETEAGQADAEPETDEVEAQNASTEEPVEEPPEQASVPALPLAGLLAAIGFAHVIAPSREAR